MTTTAATASAYAGRLAAQIIAANHALNVEDAAYDLRETLDAIDNGDAVKPETLIRRARALLAAIGEDAS